MFITKAAIMYANGEVLEGRDYGYIEGLAHKLGFPAPKIQGFLSSTGDFLLPGEAANIAVNSGQVKGNVKKLTPDMLWPQGMMDR